ncbi:AAA family ATPase [Roseivirga pacifica]|uniref:AAA family ATPase n=1 Tax=Roseivirga pacifica TaxID=1267423 RepID=UPI003BB07D7E
MTLRTSKLLTSLPKPTKLKDHLKIYNECKQLSRNQDLIQNISQVNVVIGPNNSGKSLFCRELLKTELKSEFLSGETLNQYNTLLEDTKDHIIEVMDNHDAFKLISNSIEISQNDILTILDPITNTTPIRENVHSIQDLFKNLITNRFYSIGLNRQRGRNLSLDTHLSQRMVDSFNNIRTNFSDEIDQYKFQTLIKRIYLPTYRSLKNYQQDLKLEERINHEYSLNIGQYESDLCEKDVLIQTGEKFFKEIKILHNSGFNNMKRLENYKNFLSKNFFDNQKIYLIPNEEERTIYIKIGSEEEQPIHNLGDGLQAIIIITFQIFNHSHALMVVEEPELYIHPSFQKKLINIFANDSRAKNFVVFFVTHSNHIMEAALSTQNSSLITIEKILKSTKSEDSVLPSFNLRTIKFGDSDILDSLGVSNNSVFQSNCLIWVEGTTDRIYLNAILSRYCSESKVDDFSFIEGKDYSFVFTGGDSLIHYSFDNQDSIDSLSNQSSTKFICSKSFVIVDSDEKKNIRRKNELKNKLGLNFLELPVIEIENLLSPEVIKKTITSFPSFKKIKATDLPNFETVEYKSTRLGSFIDQHVTKAIWSRGMKKFSKNQTDNSTINDKVHFCLNAKEFITQEPLTKEAKTVARKLLNFIKESNKA